MTWDPAQECKEINEPRLRSGTCKQLCIQTLSSFRQPSLKAYLKTNLSSWHLPVSWFDWQLYHPWFKSMHNTYFSLEKIKILSFFTILYPIHSLHPFQDTNWWVCSINLLSSDIPPINCTIGRHITLHILIYQGYINLERLPYMPIKATTKNHSQNITI